MYNVGDRGYYLGMYGAMVDDVEGIWMHLSIPSTEGYWLMRDGRKSVVDKEPVFYTWADMPLVDLKLIRIPTGIMVLHQCQTTDSHNAYGNMKLCPAWQRIRSGLWRARHLQAYGKQCKVCRRKMPTEEHLEEMYIKAELEGLDKLPVFNLSH